MLTGPTRPPAPTEPDHKYAHAVHAANPADRSEPSEAFQALISPKARLTAFSKRIDFGKAPVGASRRRTLRLRNTARGPSKVWQSVPRPPYAWVGPTSLIIPHIVTKLLGPAAPSAVANYTNDDSQAIRPGDRQRQTGTCLRPRLGENRRTSRQGTRV